MSVEKRQALLPGDLVFTTFYTQMFVSESSWAESRMVPPGTPAIVLLGRKYVSDAGRQWHQLLIADGVLWVESPNWFKKEATTT